MSDVEGNKKNIIREKSYNFALSIIKLGVQIQKQNKEYVLTRQLIRSSTSIGANVEEANGAISRKEFISKLQIALKESREAHYWLRLVHDSGYISKEEFEMHIFQNEEMIKILTKILKSSKIQN